MKKHTLSGYISHLLLFLFIILSINSSAHNTCCGRNMHYKKDTLDLNLEQVLTEFFTLKKDEFIQQMQRNERIKIEHLDSTCNFVFRLNFQDEIVNYIISKKYNYKIEAFVDSELDLNYTDINILANNIVFDKKMPNIYFAELSFSIPILWRTEIDNKNSTEIIAYLDKNLGITNDKIKSILNKHIKLFIGEFNDILQTNNTNTNGIFLLGHMEFSAEIHDEYKKPAIKKKLFTLLEYSKHNAPTNDYNRLLNCVKSELHNNYETNNNAYTRLSAYFQSIVDYVNGLNVCEENNNGEGLLGFDCLPASQSEGNSEVIEIEKGAIGNCKNFFVGDKIKVFSNDEYSKIEKFGINSFGRLVYVTDNQNKKHTFARTCSLNSDGSIKEYFTSSRLINFELIKQQITGNLPLSNGVSATDRMDQDYQTQTIISGINKNNYLIANLVSDIPCLSGNQVVFINEDQVFVKILSEQDCNNISNFWATFNIATPASALINQLVYEKREKTLTVDVAKRNIALDKLLTANTNVSGRDHALLKMIEAFYPNEHKEVVYKLETYGINKLFDEFKSAPYYVDFSSESLLEFALVLSSIINGDDFPESKLTAEKATDFMHNADNILVLEGNPCEFKNLNYEWVDGTTIKLIGSTSSKTVNYKELIPVKINSTINLGSVSLLPGSIEILPALQVATFALENDRKINETVGYIALDIFGLCIGMTEIKILFEAGNIIRKTIIAADIIGNSSSLAIQLINEDAIDPVLRNRIQIASTAIAVMGVLFSLTDVGKVVDDMSKTRALSKEEFIPENLNKYDEIRKSFTESCLEHSGIQKRFSDEILSLSPDLKIAGNICDFECKVGTFGCFSGQTKVLTEAGKREIKLISKDDKVWTYNFTKKIKEIKPIIGIKNYLVAAILSIVMSSGDTIWATPNHPFYTLSGYKEASELNAGDTLQNYAGRYESIISKALIDTSIQVYDLTVEDNHNYYVGKDNILVHNNGECFLRNIGDNYSTLASKIDELDEARKGEFLLDFYDAPDDVLRLLDGNPGAVKAWDILYDAGYTTLRKNPVSLQKLDKLISNPSLTTSNLTEDLVRRAIKGNRGAGAGATAIDDLTDGLNSLVNSGTNFTNYTRLIGDLEKGSGFAEGAGWVQKYVVGNTSEFAGKNLEFEIGVISGRVDLKVGNILYEFKSVGSLPPTSFTKQVARDLQNVTSFDQIKWYFDGSKLLNGITQADKDAMLSVLDNMNLNEATLRNFLDQGPYTIEAMIDQIEIRFFDIFQVK